MGEAATTTPNELDPRVAGALQATWGYSTLRPLQAEAINAAIEGRDALVVLPTGGGKSLCYQLPPLVTGRLTLVVSPLIALMKDQLDGLTLAGFPAHAVHSQMDDEDVRAAFASMRDGSCKLVLTSPERALTSSFLRALREVPGGLGAIAVDEAHCVSHWGHDFRPEYRRLHELRSTFPDVAVQAFTATATPHVQQDIVAQLELRDASVHVGSVDRPNLTYRVVRKTEPTRQIADAIIRVQADEPNAAAIVYCISRRETEDLAERLRNKGVDARAYHAGLDANKRRKIQDAFTRERLDVVCATVAFGMGIDRSNVRLVVHAGMPKSLEAYQQEAGRAGRDGLPAECLLLYAGKDMQRWRTLVERSAEESGVAPELVRAQVDQLRTMQRFCTGVTCRHRRLAEHFGQELGADCGACDVCLGETETVADGVTLARKILSAVARTGQRFGAGQVADVLRGSRTDKVTQWEHDQLSVFGLLGDLRKTEIMSYIDQLSEQELLTRGDDRMPIFALTERGLAVMKGDDEDVALSAAAQASPERRRRGPVKDTGPMSPGERELFEALRALRRSIAEENGVPPYVVFNDATLREMAKQAPASKGAMLEVKGIGQRKLEAFGDAFLERIAEHSDANKG